MKEVSLTKGKFALVDDEDFELVCKYKWYAVTNKSGIWYASTTIGGNSFGMHRLILGIKYVDHIDRDGLNNQRNNLRPTNPSLNMANAKKRGTNTTSQYKGVSWSLYKQKWQASASKDGKRYFLGYFSSEIEAAKAYDRKLEELFGDYARINFP
jgi:hypothetical protein